MVYLLFFNIHINVAPVIAPYKKAPITNVKMEISLPDTKLAKNVIRTQIPHS